MDQFWKNKKIIAYIALAHHTRFITPVMDDLTTKGANIRYIVGQAERSQEITAIELGLQYAHIYDYIFPKDHDEILKNYHFLVKSFAGSLKRDFILGLLPVTVTDKTLYATAMEYTGLKNLIKKEQPDLCFALHELNRWGKMFAFWAKKENIPFITLQEGLTYDTDFGYSGHAQYSTLNLVWGERVKKKMAGFEAPESKIWPVGNTHLARELAVQKQKNIRLTKRKAYGISSHYTVLLILSATLPLPDLLTPIFKAVSQNSGQTLFVKFHPACKKQQIDKWKTLIDSSAKAKTIHFIHGEENTYDLISMADVCVLGQRSTTGLEAIAFGKPLVKLDFAYSKNAPYSFVDQGVAKKMSPDEFAKALADRTDFSDFIDTKKTERYLKGEIIDTTGSIENISRVFQQTIEASRFRIRPISPSTKGFDKQWSIILPVPDRSQAFLAQLEAIAFNSENQGEYEIILLEPEKKSKEILCILDSLMGDIKRIPCPAKANLISLINQAAENARGEHLIFLEKNLAPLKGWLSHLSQGFDNHGGNKVFGARVCDAKGKIMCAGMVVDKNHSPVSAYPYLSVDFEAAKKERSFQMVDYFAAMKKNVFCKAGGFTPEAGKYKIPDFCLKAAKVAKDPEAVFYLPDLTLIFVDPVRQKETMDEAVYFYGKWHGSLWESEQALYKTDGISPEDLARARLAAAMQTLGS